MVWEALEIYVAVTLEAKDMANLPREGMQIDAELDRKDCKGSSEIDWANGGMS